MRVLTAFLLLLTLGLTLGLGAHPCGASERMETETESVSTAAPSCHAHAAAVASEASESGKDSETGTEHPCPHFCHTAAALLAMTPPLLTVEAVAQIATVHIERALAAPARSIDHVPLV
jgi:hypothetical protein